MSPTHLGDRRRDTQQPGRLIERAITAAIVLVLLIAIVASIF